MAKYDCIVWDWNGTLLDDVSASLRSVNAMLAKRGMEPIDILRYRECIGVPIRGFYEKVFELEKEDYAALLAEYNSGYLHYLADCGIAEGARELLDRAARLGIRQIIVSSSEKNQLVKAVTDYGISDYFDAILGADDFLAAGKVERARAYLSTIACGKRPRLLAVGDLLHDAEMARQINAECVLLESGHEDRRRLEKSGATVVKSIGEWLKTADF